MTTNAVEKPATGCGCVRGVTLCPEAQRLWLETSAAYETACRRDWWRDYDRLRQAYRAHVEAAG